MKASKRQKGFTLVEIAIVLVIIGLLLGGILKGQELINSARVRNMGDLAAGIQASYYGFIDRYRKVPGDWAPSLATNAIGITINKGGNNNGRIDVPATGTKWDEASGVWEQMSKAGFISGRYEGAVDEGEYEGDPEAPTNPFNGPLILFRTNDYLDVGGSGITRLNLVLGKNTPVDIALELDTKLDDGNPERGVIRSAVSAGALFTESGMAEGDANCVTTVAPARWDVPANSPDCNVVFLY